MAEATVIKKTKDSICGVTSTGFEFSVKKAAFEDVEFLDELEEAMDPQSEVMHSYGKLCTRLLGTDQKKELYDFFRDKEGRVPMQSINDAFVEILDSYDEGKNS